MSVPPQPPAPPSGGWPQAGPAHPAPGFPPPGPPPVGPGMAPGPGQPPPGTGPFPGPGHTGPYGPPPGAFPGLGGAPGPFPTQPGYGPPMPPPRKKTGLFAGLGAGGVLLLVAAGFGVVGGIKGVTGESSHDHGSMADTSSPESVVRDYTDGFNFKRGTTVESALCQENLDTFKQVGSSVSAMVEGDSEVQFIATAGPVTRIDGTRAKVNITIDEHGRTMSGDEKAGFALFSGAMLVTKQADGWKVCVPVKARN